MPHVDAPADRRGHLCAICRKELQAKEHKTHVGHCARVRKSQLQKLRRWRRRRFSYSA